MICPYCGVYLEEDTNVSGEYWCYTCDNYVITEEDDSDDCVSEL